MAEAQKKKKKKSWIWVLLFILMNVGILLWTGLAELKRKESSGASISDIEIRWPFFLLSALCLLVTIVAESGKYYSLIKRLTGRSEWGLSFKITIYGRYYDNITPSGSGGQPFQIMYLKKKGLPDGAALAVPVYAFLLHEITFVLISILFFACFGHLFEHQAIKVTAYIGLVCYSLVPTAIILSAVFPHTMGKIIMWFLRAGAALRLIKDPEKKGESVIRQIQEYSQAINYINRHRRLSAEMFLLSLLFHLARFSLPFLILLAFGANADWLSVTTATAFIHGAITIIPTPGGAGAAEASFYLVFSSLPEAGLVFWAMLLWRFFSDYIFILSGILLTAFEYMQGKLKESRRNRYSVQKPQ